MAALICLGLRSCETRCAAGRKHVWQAKLCPIVMCCDSTSLSLMPRKACVCARVRSSRLPHTYLTSAPTMCWRCILAFLVVHLCLKSSDADTSESAIFKNRMEQMIVGALACNKDLNRDGHAVCKSSKNVCLMVLRSSFAALFLRRLQLRDAINCTSFSS
jgi:hypothetical protein